MKQNQDNSLWSKVKELMGRINTLLVNKIENWTKELDKKIEADGSVKSETPAKVVDTVAPDGQNYYTETNHEPTPTTVINKTNVTLGLGELLFFGLIIYAFFSVPDKTDHAEAIIKTIPINEIYNKEPEIILLDDNKVHAALKAAILENFEVENYYLFSVCHRKSSNYDFLDDLLDGNFISFGILGKVFPRQEIIEAMIEKKIEENREKEQRTSLGDGSDNGEAFHRDDDAELADYLEIVKNTQQFGDEIEAYAHGCDYQVTHTVVVANRSGRDVAAQEYNLSVEPVGNDDYDDTEYSFNNTSYVSGKDIPAHGTATFSWTDTHFDGTWTYEDSVVLEMTGL